MVGQFWWEIVPTGMAVHSMQRGFTKEGQGRVFILLHPHKIPQLLCNWSPPLASQVAMPALGVGGNMESCVPRAPALPLWVWMMALQLMSSHPIHVTHLPYHVASKPIKLGMENTWVPGCCEVQMRKCTESNEEDAWLIVSTLKSCSHLPLATVYF